MKSLKPSPQASLQSKLSNCCAAQNSPDANNMNTWKRIQTNMMICGEARAHLSTHPTFCLLQKLFFCRTVFFWYNPDQCEHGSSLFCPWGFVVYSLRECGSGVSCFVFQDILTLKLLDSIQVQNTHQWITKTKLDMKQTTTYSLVCTIFACMFFCTALLVSFQ
jgi:hypothetical protein